MKRKLTPILAMLAVIALCNSVMAGENGSARQMPGNPFYAFDNGTDRAHLSPDAQAQMLKELGYAGIGVGGTQRIPEWLKALDSRGLKLFSIYVAACVDAGKPPYDPGLKTAIAQLKGRDTVILLVLTGGKPSSPDRDDRAVAIIREIGELAEKSNLRVALYPHVGLHAARVEDALRLAKKVDRKNVGICFNLCHFLKSDDEKNLNVRLREALPYLFAVSINGADGGETRKMGWDRLIQTLDRGSFQVSRVLSELANLGYWGPIGLQCYSIPGDARDNLHRSMEGWRKLTARTAAEP